MRIARLFLFAFLIGCSGSSGGSPDTAAADAIVDDGATGDAPSMDEGGPSTTDSGGKGDAVPPPVDGGPLGSGGTQLVVEPDDGIAPILGAIDGAKKSLHVEMYLLSSTTFINALKKAKSRGVDVQVVLEKTPYGAPGGNDYAQSALSAAGVGVAWANASLYKLTHSKFMVVDGATAIIMSMNMTGSAFTSNREYGLFDADPADVAEAEAMFAADFAGSPYAASGALVVAPTNAEADVLALIDSAKTSLDLEFEELGSYKVDDHLASAKSRGVAIRIVVSDGTSSTTASAVMALTAKGIEVRKLHSPTVHAKAIVVDGARAFLGSENLTTGSLVYNREVGVVTHTAAFVSRIQTTIAADYAKGVPY